ALSMRFARSPFGRPGSAGGRSTKRRRSENLLPVGAATKARGTGNTGGPGSSAHSPAAVRPKEDPRGEGGTDQIEDEIPAGVFIPAHICFGQRQGGDELDHLVEGAEAHP